MSEFESWAKKQPYISDDIDVYEVCEAAWDEALINSKGRIEALEHDLSRHIEIASEAVTKYEALEVLISELIEVLGALQAPSTQRDLVELWNAYVDVTSAMEGGNK